MTVLLTGGNSFSVPGLLEEDYTWVDYLQKSHDFSKSVHTGTVAQGNELISRKIIYNVIELLKDCKSEDILVGIMWSSPKFQSVYLESSPKNFTKLFLNQENPTSVVDKENHWYILNPPRAPGIVEHDEHSSAYYKYFYNSTSSYVETCEHILRTQWFLDKCKISYFMTAYNQNVLPSSLKNLKETSHLYNLINFDNFLPIDSGQSEWCKTKATAYSHQMNNSHPSHLQHKQFTEEVILPFIKDKKYI